MAVKILSITLLLLSVCLCCHASTARRRPKPPRPCCIAVTTLNMSAEVVGETYRVQPAAYPCVKAVIFNTDYGNLCADPKAPWVKNLIAKMTEV